MFKTIQVLFIFELLQWKSCIINFKVYLDIYHGVVEN